MAQLILIFLVRALAELDGNNCKNLSRIISDNIDIVKLGMSNSKGSRKNCSNKHDCFITNPKRHENGEISKNPSPKLANEPPNFKTDFDDDDDDDDEEDVITELALPGLEVTKMSRKTFCNFLKYRFSLPKNGKENKCEPNTKTAEKPDIQNT